MPARRVEAFLRANGVDPGLASQWASELSAPAPGWGRLTLEQTLEELLEETRQRLERWIAVRWGLDEGDTRALLIARSRLAELRDNPVGYLMNPPLSLPPPTPPETPLPMPIQSLCLRTPCGRCLHGVRHLWRWLRVKLHRA
ncbi:MAG: hypothetical protein WCP34_01045 [Pseudomonadota bacterium]